MAFFSWIAKTVSTVKQTVAQIALVISPYVAPVVNVITALLPSTKSTIYSVVNFLSGLTSLTPLSQSDFNKLTAAQLNEFASSPLALLRLSTATPAQLKGWLTANVGQVASLTSAWDFVSSGIMGELSDIHEQMGEEALLAWLDAKGDHTMATLSTTAVSNFSRFMMDTLFAGNMLGDMTVAQLQGWLEKNHLKISDVPEEWFPALSGALTAVQLHYLSREKPQSLLPNGAIQVISHGQEASETGTDAIVVDFSPHKSATLVLDESVSAAHRVFEIKTKIDNVYKTMQYDHEFTALFNKVDWYIRDGDKSTILNLYNVVADYNDWSRGYSTNYTTASLHVFAGGGDDIVQMGNSSAHVHGGEGWDTLSYASIDGYIELDLLRYKGVLKEISGGSEYRSVENAHLWTLRLEDYSYKRYIDVAGGPNKDEPYWTVDTISRIDWFFDFEAFEGSRGNDLMKGDGVNNYFDGGAGDDRLFGNGGNDSLIGGAGDDHLLGDVGNDTLIGGAGSDFVEGHQGDDLIVQDIEYGAFDRLDGGDGKDTVDYSRAIIVDPKGFGVVGDLSSGLVQKINVGNNGQSISTDSLWSIENLIGTSGVDTFYGNAAANRLEGMAGDDYLAGREGMDTLVGGLGNDIYQFSRGDGADEIIETSGSDTLKFCDCVDSNQLWFNRSGADMVIRVMGTHDMITVKDWYMLPNNGGKIEQLTLGNGKTLSLNGAEALVSAMASFGVPGLGVSEISGSRFRGLEVALASNWQ